MWKKLLFAPLFAFSVQAATVASRRSSFDSCSAHRVSLNPIVGNPSRLVSSFVSPVSRRVPSRVGDAAAPIDFSTVSTLLNSSSDDDANSQEKSQTQSSVPRKSTSSNPSSKSPIREEIRYIAGRRALLLHPPTPPQNPPLIILGGMAQSIASWELHLSHLSQDRSVLVYEALGQGPPPPSEVCSIDVGEGKKREVTLEQYYDDVSLERQGRDFWEVVEEAFLGDDSYYHEYYGLFGNNSQGVNDGLNRKVDVAGFSFGGRVAMAASSLQPNRIRKLHLTGVGAERDDFANVVLASWKEVLGVGSGLSGLSDSGTNKDSYSYNDEEECDPEIHASRCTARLRAFAWSIIMTTYSEQFLATAGPKRVQSWVDGVCRYNTEEGLKALLMQTHGSFLGNELKNKENDTDLWTPAEMAKRIQSSGAVEHFKVVVGSQDKMAAPSQALRLAKMLRLNHGTDVDNDQYDNSTFKVMEGCGHAVPMEAMRLWREDVLGFLKI